ncbi:MAG: hypothetical protein JXA73_08810 [Acidobacteria bacterium]|nr:hypothetical protein [Acidobacteriota bacterium]
MPGSVQNAAPTTVLPWSLSKAFTHSREYIVKENEYPDGTSQRGLLVSTSRKRWNTSRRLTASILASFRTFYLARKSWLEPFYFYDPWDANFAYDPTGASSTGRYTVRFAGSWDQMVGMRRADCEIALIEIA